MKRTEELKKIPERFVEEAFVLGITSKLKLLVMHSQSNEFVAKRSWGPKRSKKGHGVASCLLI